MREERRSDAAAIAAVHEAAFPSPAEARLVDELRASSRATISLVAETGRGVVSHVLFSPVTADRAPPESRGLGLAPLAVHPSEQRRGHGARLVRAGLVRAAELGFDYVVVLGAPAYYARFGFSAASERGLGNEYGAGPEFQALALRAGGLDGVAGLVRYAPEFAPFGGE